MLKKIIFGLVLSVVLFSCEDEKNIETHFVKEKTIENEFPVIIDTLPDKLNTNYVFEGTPRAQYQPYYLGNLADTIKIGRRIYYFSPPPPINGGEIIKDTIKTVWNQFDDYFIFWTEYDLLCERGFYQEKDTLGSFDIEVDNRQIVKNCFPVIITNNFLDTLIIGDLTDGVNITIEAKNENGDWQIIEKRYNDCGAFITFILLPPSESVIVLAPIYKGKFITQLRMKMGEFYSKEFTGTVKKSQFFNPKEYYK